MVDDPEFSIRVESKDGDRISPWVVVCAGVTVRGVDQSGGEGFVRGGDQDLRSSEVCSRQCSLIFRNN